MARGAEGDGEEATAHSGNCSKPRGDALRLPVPALLDQGASEMVTARSCSQPVYLRLFCHLSWSLNASVNTEPALRSEKNKLILKAMF